VVKLVILSKEVKKMETSWWELAGIIFFSFMVITVGLIWALAIKASYNEEKEKQKQQENK
jgi:hypothetical protein